ncbi:restriction endonuclease subunit S [Acinetobacter junii]|uniref:restriction endonuclease subunit S n=1 Tax=Acinetobacter junii TaxID=40215 RepID=UPI00124FC06E|nr:restriction endonuclease subunit S [Acinetobacter junii]
MAKYQKYAEYKASGFKAFGQIPNHWDVLNLRYVFDFLNEKRFPLSSLERAEKKGQYPYYGASGIIDYVDEYILNEKTILIAEDGANLLSRSTPLAFIAQGKYWVNNHAHILKPKNLQFNFWTYFLQSLDFTIYITGSAQPKLSRENLGDVVVLKPSLNEQQIIANFLDHETTKIDHLIEKQQQLIELLKEKRQAVISHAVTKGLNPNVPMKDSGVEWLGEVPEHWDILKLSAIADITRLAGYEYTEYWQSDDDGEIIAIRGQNIRFNKLVNLDTAERITNKLSMRLKRSRLYKNDIAFPCVGTIGNAVLINESDKYHINQNIAKLTPNLKIHPLYLVFFLNSLICLESALFLNTSDAQPSILVGNLRKVKIAFPSINEQIEIAENINEQLKQIDGLIFESNKMISLFIERRTSLISAAVTGKIDVRHWQAPTVAEAQTELSA